MHSTVCVRRLFGVDEAELAHHAARREFNADFGDQKFSGDGEEHFLGDVAFVEQHFALRGICAGS